MASSQRLRVPKKLLTERSYLGLDWLANLLGDLLGNWGTDNILLNVAGSDWHSLGDLLGGVDAHLLGHLTAVRLDSHLTGGLGNSLNLDCWSSMDGSTIASSIDSCTMSNSSSVSTITMAGLSLPLVNTVAQFP